MPKISVIIPVYNTEEYLERCIQSLINQTLSDIEIIFINDCSTDNSLAILEKFAGIDDRIQVYTLEKNSGAAVARNVGLDHATGEYLNFVDSDDMIDLDFYEKLYQKAIETDAEVVKCCRKTFETDGRITYSDLNNLIRENGNLFFGYEWQCAIFKTALIRENNIKFTPELIKAQDVVFLNKIMLKTTKPIEFAEGVYYNYYRRSDSLNAAKIPLKYIQSAVLAKKIQCEDLNNSDLSEKNPKLYAELYAQRPAVLTGITAFQNPDYDAKLVCAKGIIDCYQQCKDKKAFQNDFFYDFLMPYIKHNQPEKLAQLLYKAKNEGELSKKVRKVTFFQQIFSIKKSMDRKSNILRLLGIKIKLRIKDERSVHAAKIIHENIKRYKYVHIMKNDKFNKPFVDFLNKNFNKDEHMVLCYRDPRYSDIIHKFPEGDNVYEYFDIKDINLKKYKNIKKVILHSLFMPKIVPYLYKNKKLLKEKAYWAIWGGDLYNAKRDEMNDYVRANFKGYLSGVDNDIAIKKYNIKGKPFYTAFGIFPISKEIIQKTVKPEKDFIKIQINNSCDESTLEMLDVLSKFKDENIKITTILSYGEKLKSKDKIIEKGKEIFKDKFEYVNYYLPVEEYTRYLAQNDVLIFNQDRQQGVGNIIASLALGTKVFIKSEISTCGYLQNNGITIFDTNEIPAMDFDTFTANKYVENNKKNVMKFFDDAYIASLWKEFLEAE